MTGFLFADRWNALRTVGGVEGGLHGDDYDVLRSIATVPAKQSAALDRRCGH